MHEAPFSEITLSNAFEMCEKKNINILIVVFEIRISMEMLVEFQRGKTFAPWTQFD